ncbi:hypothetical protein V8C43DRAFT_299460 [Trichoderma afarasin]
MKIPTTHLLAIFLIQFGNIGPSAANNDLVAIPHSEPNCSGALVGSSYVVSPQSKRHKVKAGSLQLVHEKGMGEHKKIAVHMSNGVIQCLKPGDWMCVQHGIKFKTTVRNSECTPN